MEQVYTVKNWLLRLDRVIEEIGVIDPFCGIWIIADGIEFLGKCIHSDNFNSRGNCSNKFQEAIEKIPAFDQYKQIKNLYDKLRCGLTHAMRPGNHLILTDKGPNSINGQRACISFEQLQSDFSKGIKQLIAGENGLRTDRLKISYVVESNQAGKSTTGSTQSTTFLIK